MWVGCGLVAVVCFGGNGMQPRDLTGLAFANPAVGGALVAIWLLVFVPVARAIVRPDERTGERWLRSLPHRARDRWLVGGAALVGLQLPWLALWVIGAAARGAAVVGATTIAAAAIAAIPLPRRRAGWPGWRSATGALASVHRRAIVRRAGDAIARGVGIAALAGLAAALFVRNNQETGEGAARLGTAIALLVLVPARAGMILAVHDSHRRSAWLAESLGLSRGARVLALVRALVAVDIAAMAIAIGVAAIGAAPDAPTLALWAVVALACAVASAIAEAGAIARVADRGDAPKRDTGTAMDQAPALLVRVVAIAAAGMFALGLLGAIGAVGFLAAAMLVAA